MRTITASLILLTALLSNAVASADELLQIIQQDLAALGYETGNTSGEMNTQTIVAISKFQAEHSLEVTGEPTPQLAGIVKAAKYGKHVQTDAVGTTDAPASRDETALRMAQQACLQEKVAAAQKRNKKKRGLGSLMRAVSRTASQFGSSDLARSVSETTHDIYNVNATAADLESAAEDLGLTPGDIEACRNAQ